MGIVFGREEIRKTNERINDLEGNVKKNQSMISDLHERAREKNEFGKKKPKAKPKSKPKAKPKTKPKKKR